MHLQKILEQLDNIDLSVIKLKNILIEFKNNIEIMNALASHINKKSIMYEYNQEEIELMVNLLVKLSYIDNINIKIAVAKNSYTPNYILKKLSKSRVDLIRATVSTNENANSYILNRLYKDRVEIVIDALAGNSATPIKILDKLSRSRDKMIRMRVAENPSTPKYILERLISNSDGDVIKASKNSLN
ncbi:Leucine rich repeat variant [hydrothermal vent metagenome]|uniref:Leucine rich repeat variant n=1 Tax=hydrothermal vent metagenome TaxID=652676 RepID=A0A1W1EJH8_9ZZZZ